MDEYHARLIEEKRELDNKLARLTAFFATKRYAELSEAERSRLRSQSLFMGGYSMVLGERLQALEEQS